MTRATSGSDFDVNGVRIVCREKAPGLSASLNGAPKAAVECPSDPPYVGEILVVDYHSQDKGSNSIYPIRIKRQPGQFHEVSGSAVINAAPFAEATGTQVSGLLVHADGYRIRITGKTRIEWIPPLQSLADVKAGNWIKFKGKPNAGGVLDAASVRIGLNEIGDGEKNLRKKDEYDPSAVPEQARQSYLKDALRGSYDPKQFPPFKEPAMQARTEKIGNSLVPAYQRALPDSDPAKINFRFEVIDTKLFRDSFTLPNGIILVPHQVVDRLQNDSQLAAVLASGIARALERQQYRMKGKIKTAYASAMAAPFVPYAGLGMSLGGEVAKDIQKKAMEQCDRVSLALLRDAGYDVDQTPMAWWLLATEKPQPVTEIEMPDRTDYLYRILGEIWDNPAASAPNVQ